MIDPDAIPSLAVILVVGFAALAVLWWIIVERESRS